MESRADVGETNRRMQEAAGRDGHPNQWHRPGQRCGQGDRKKARVVEHANVAKDLSELKCHCCGNSGHKKVD